MKKITKKIYNYDNRLYEYQANPVHRTNHNLQKSQWSISLEQEYRMFEEAVNNNWFTNPDEDKFFGYGIFLPQEQEATPIGIGEKKLPNGNRNKVLYIAKFDLDSNVWHGYPCGDKQSDFFLLKNFHVILNQWISAKYITKAKFLKIHKGYSL